jgi:DNA end-binding protein Ku
VALRSRESLATLRVADGVFVLETMLWPDEVRAPAFPFLEENIDVRPQELAMASSLIETMAADFDPSEYTDAYREALQAVIDAKAEGREVVQPEEMKAEPAATDLLAALRASVEAAKKSRTPTSAETAKRKPTTARKTTTARKPTAAKKPAAKKPAPRKTA